MKEMFITEAVKETIIISDYGIYFRNKKNEVAIPRDKIAKKLKYSLGGITITTKNEKGFLKSYIFTAEKSDKERLLDTIEKFNQLIGLPIPADSDFSLESFQQDLSAKKDADDAIEKAKQEMLDRLKHGAEIRKRCTVCGEVFCFNYEDVQENERLKKEARSAQLRGALNSLAVSEVLGNQQRAEADRKRAQIRDFDRCPKCNSASVVEISEDEFKAAMSGGNNAAPAPSSSPADELKKFKELLDMGIITQDEFDAKKKQLLGL